jgi:hypothetical protein
MRKGIFERQLKNDVQTKMRGFRNFCKSGKTDKIEKIENHFHPIGGKNGFFLQHIGGK